MKFVLIVSKVTLSAGEHPPPSACAPPKRKSASAAGTGATTWAPTPSTPLCGRCVSNLFGDGEARAHA